MVWTPASGHRIGATQLGQQIGVALGLACSRGSRRPAATAGVASSGPQALVDGYSTALLTGAATLLGATMLAVLSASGKVSNQARLDTPETESGRMRRPSAEMCPAPRPRALVHQDPIGRGDSIRDTQSRQFDRPAR